MQDDGQSPENNCDHIQPSGIIAKITLGIPTIDEDWYERFVIELEDDDYDVFAFAYDWRLDIEENAQRLDAYITNTVLRETGASKVVLVGHSLGGFVIRQYVLDVRRAQKVEKVITVGTPYWGVPGLAKHMRTGATGLPIDFLLDDKVIWRLFRNSPAAMQILPSEAYFQQYGGAAAYYIDDTRDLDSYQKTLDFFKMKGQNGTLIEQARDLHRAIDDFRRNLNVPYYVLTANHKDAVNVVREYPCLWGGMCWDEDSYISGDGTVPWISARLYGAAGDWSGDAQVCTFSNTPEHKYKEHGELLSDEYVIEDIKRILRGEPIGGQDSYCKSPQAIAQTQSAPEPLIQIAVLGNTRASVRDAAGNFTGITDEGFISNEIPLASYRLAGSSTFIILPSFTTYTLYIGQESNTPIQVRVTNLQAPSLEEEFSPHQRAVFVDVPAATGGVATMNVDPTASLSNLRLSVDLDNNGVPESVLPPTSTLDQQQSQDFTRPTTAITVQGTQDTWGFYTGPVTIRLSATDTGTGVLKTEYSLDGGQTWQPYTGPINFVAEQVPIFYASSVDRAGNHEYPWPNRRLRPYSLRPDTLYLPLTLKNYPTGWESCLAESPHPYPDNYNNTWTLTNPDTNAISTRIHFSRLETESGWDYVYVRDANNNEVNRFDGIRSDVWSSTVPGRTVKVQLTSDGSVTAWGFCVDRMETVSSVSTNGSLVMRVAIRLDWK